MRTAQHVPEDLWPDAVSVSFSEMVGVVVGHMRDLPSAQSFAKRVISRQKIFRVGAE